MSKDELRNMKTLLQQYKMAVDKSAILSKTDPNGIITYANEEFCKLSKYSHEELIGKSHRIVRHPDNPKSLFEDMWKTIKSGKIWKGMIKNRAKDGSDYYVSATIIPILNNENEIVEFLGIRHDVTELYLKDKLIEKARKDDVTGLNSRAAFLEDISCYKTKGVVIIDISSFNYINDFYGYEVGDKLLYEVARELKNFFKGQILYRFPIDIFVILYKNRDIQIEKMTKDVKEFLDKFRSYPKLVDNIQFYAHAVAGISIGYDEDVYQEADIALQFAKKNKRQIQIYSNELNIKKEIEKNFYISKLINEAIYNNSVLVFFQPIVNNKTLKYEKYEALVRIKDEEGKIVSPSIFLDIAKKTSIYPTLTQHIIRNTLSIFENAKDVEVSINLSVEDIEDIKTRNFLLDTFSTNEISKRVVIEITESEEVKDLENVSAFLKKLKKYGCKIAIDDFGSGYSNFKYLLDIQADFIKIDGSLIKKLDSDESSEAIVKAIVSFAKKMGIKTVAEFVSSKEIFEKVKALEVDYSQGFYFSPAIEKPFN